MRKLFIGVFLLTIFILLGLGLIYVKREVDTAYNSLPVKEKTASATNDLIEIDRAYMDFYEIDDFSTTLPVMFIETNGNEITGNDPVMVRCSLINSENDENEHSITDKVDISLNASIKHRGASSKHFEKRQFRLTFFKDPYGQKKLSYDLFGMGAGDSWVLHGPFLDKSLARNYLVYTIGQEMMDWVPECRYMELFVDGRYQGVYLALEPVSADPGRLDLSTFGLLSGRVAYIVGRDRVGSDIKPLENYGKINGYTSNNLYVTYPGKKSITASQYDWITDDISVFEMALYGEDYKSDINGYADYIDVDSFVDYYIINEVVMNHDAGNLSTFAYKEIDGKLKMTIWDFNNCYDNYQWFTEDFDAFYVTNVSWFDRLLTDRAFVDKVVSRYYDLRKTSLSTEHMISIVDDSKKIIGDAAVERNYKIWGYTFSNGLLSGKRELRSYQEAREQLENSIVKRFEFLDEHITDLYDMCED